MFWKPQDRMNANFYDFSGFKQWYKVCLVYLDCELQKIGMADAFSS